MQTVSLGGDWAKCAENGIKNSDKSTRRSKDLSLTFVSFAIETCERLTKSALTETLL